MSIALLNSLNQCSFYCTFSECNKYYALYVSSLPPLKQRHAAEVLNYPKFELIAGLMKTARNEPLPCAEGVFNEETNAHSL